MRLSIIAAALPLALAAPAADMAPLMVPRDAQTIDGKYIVKFKDSSTIGGMEAAQATVGEVQHVYQDVFNGFSAQMTADQVTELRKDPNVEFIEHDSVVSINNNNIVEQKGATWGLARISTRALGATSYFYDHTAGSGACVVVVDTGIAWKHPEFEGRARQLKSVLDGTVGADGHGHGTHCAGTVGSKTWGVAKKATLLGVKVLDDRGFGSAGTVIAGLNFVLTDISGKINCPRGIVVSLSLGGARSSSLNAAAAALHRKGIAVVVAAGNANVDACNVSPASEPSACAVGATTRVDARAYFSNYGPCVDVHAPGVEITSTWLNGGTNTISGTSMAAPHVAGIAAGLMANGVVNGQGACEYIKGLSTKNIVTNLPANTINSLAFSASFRASGN
ncbi:alkaline serine protease [Cordyceps fumosorosea ARSEF 2679]|uniref:Alkaline serine protease n=1 Tax=Cordyceps fumosorosea (strain ARSEF 2679) TaxID=1081104 RepID=A0A167UBL4_CORFA|nr:alkaline serine protease [Cordyceps fumosorosea ARSEF 2679]OAA61421.1 alkaline serine protease [Cordyceps fumosorosea ARSEF 2679]